MIEHVDQKMFESLVATGHARGVLSLDEVEAILGGDCDRQTVDDVVEVLKANNIVLVENRVNQREGTLNQLRTFNQSAALTQSEKDE